MIRNRQSITPMSVPRTRRNHALTILSSGTVGRIIPIAAVGLLREDAVPEGMAQVACEMGETAEIILNPIRATFEAWFVPFLAFERFQGSRDQFDRSYAKKNQVDGGSVVPFFETQLAGAHGANPIHRALGLHAQPTDMVSTKFIEAYNQLVNYQLRNVSGNLPLRSRLQTDLAPAFWNNRLGYIKPTFDQGAIDGEVSLIGAATKVPVRGINLAGPVQTAQAQANVRTTSGQTVSQNGWIIRSDQAANSAGTSWLTINQAGTTGHPDIWVDLAANGVTISLANIAAARKAQWFARAREAYSELSGMNETDVGDMIIDMLMSGLNVPDQDLRLPVLLDSATVNIAQQKRFATDAANLMKSAVNGMTAANLSLQLPRIHTGGVIMITASVLPEQLFERQRDPFFFMSDPALLPDYMRDELDPEKVEQVFNREIDTSHATPGGTFGWRPLNAHYNQTAPRVGGKFLRPTANTTFDEDRQRLYAIETVNPTLGADFYLASTVHQKPFLVTSPGYEPFEFTVLGNAVIEGNTVFGAELTESGEDYDAVTAKIPSTRLIK